LLSKDFFKIEKGAAQIPTGSRIKWDSFSNNRGAVIPYIIEANYSQTDLDIIISAFKMVFFIFKNFDFDIFLVSGIFVS
jgi:hypothetical protein